ncbi:selenium cofactor biosynthesis protein YqeC [Chloroflexota bacterium]
MNISQAFDIHTGEVISLVGGGGKTALMFAIARELALDGNRVITTTTTKIFAPLPSQTQKILVEGNEEELLKRLLREIDSYTHITLASEKIGLEKLIGISPELVARLAGIEKICCIIIEADGAASRPLKAPNAAEPVIPGNTSLVVPVVGVDALGCRLTQKEVFRPEIAAGLLGVPIGEIMTAGLIARLIIHPRGIAKGSPEGARIVPFINKVDLDEGLAGGRILAEMILAMGHPQIEYVVLGQAQAPDPVVEVMRGKP